MTTNLALSPAERERMEALKKTQDINGLIDVLAHHWNSDCRYEAALYLGKMKASEAVLPLISALEKDDGLHVRINAARALALIGDERALGSLIKALKNTHPFYGAIREHAAEALGNLGNPEAIDPLIAALRVKNIEVRVAAIIALGKIGNINAIKPLESIKKSDNIRLYREANEAISKISSRITK